MSQNGVIYRPAITEDLRSIANLATEHAFCSVHLAILSAPLVLFWLLVCCLEGHAFLSTINGHLGDLKNCL